MNKSIVKVEFCPTNYIIYKEYDSNNLNDWIDKEIDNTIDTSIIGTNESLVFDKYLENDNLDYDYCLYLCDKNDKSNIVRIPLLCFKFF